MPRALDHIVWPARDLDALAEAFHRLGFTVGRRNRHPWGTVNHIIQFDGCFLELLGFAEDYRSLPDDDPAAPFAGFCERFLTENEAGAAMLVLRSDDSAADARTFIAEGIGRGRVLPFSRSAQGPDGSDRTVAFTVAFADLPGLGAFVCQQHRPENFWNPAAQLHANGAEGIAAIELSTSESGVLVPALRRFAGIEDDGNFVLADGCRIGCAASERQAHWVSIDCVGIRVRDLPAVKQHLESDVFHFDREKGAFAVRSPAGSVTDLRFLPAEPDRV